MMLGHIFMNSIREKLEVPVEQENDEEGEYSCGRKLGDGAYLERRVCR